MKALIVWLIKTFLPGHHLHRDPLRKTDLGKVWGTGSPLEEDQNQSPEREEQI